MNFMEEEEQMEKEIKVDICADISDLIGL